MSSTHDTLMRGFPPDAANQVTLANWREPPYNQWSFRHVRELVPSAHIANLPPSAARLPARPRMMEAVEVVDGDRRLTVADAMAELVVHGLMVLHDGRIVFEHYRGGMTAETPHILFSVSKSVTAMVAGIVSGRGQLLPDAPITHYVPEMAGTGYEGATVRHLLDMTVGVGFEEDYTATDGDIIRSREAMAWNPRRYTPHSYHLRQFLMDMDRMETDHGSAFRYISPNTDLLGWVLERATGTRFPDLLAEALWQPMGAWRPAHITVDSIGTPRTAGGICCTLHDLALFGQLLLDGGRRDGRQVVPANWVTDTRTGGDPALWAKTVAPEDYPGWSMRYRNKVYVMGDGDAPYFGAGIFGQYVFVDPARGVVVAQFAAQPEATEPGRELTALRTFHALAAAAAGG